MSFSGKVIIITGASSGIGADAAIHLSKLGASVAIVGRDATKLHGVAEKINAAGYPKPLEIVADINVGAEKIINETIRQFGKLDVLVNNAGIIEMGTVEAGSIDTYDRIMSTNLRSVILLTQLAIPHLEKTKGNIVNISSVASNMAIPTATAYCLSKAALDQLTKCLALELAPKGIRVNSVNPGVILTPIFGTIGIKDKALEELIKHTEETYPLGRPGVVNDTSAAIAFLASDNASFITGDLLMVAGGINLATPR